MLNSTNKINLGHSDILITPLGIGTWAWGDRFFWGYGKKGDYSDSDITDAFRICVDAGINFFDTAEVYGLGRSEQILGNLIKNDPAVDGKTIIVGTKFFPFPYRLSRKNLFSSLRKSLDRLEMKKVDLYQMHFPTPPVSIETWMNAMADCVEEGLVRSVGVSNYNSEQMKKAYLALSKRGIKLVSNQVKYSLLDRKVEKEGLFALSQDLGITIIAYSPLEMGMLTGKYTPSTPPSGNRKYRYNQNFLKRIQPVIGVLNKIGQNHGGKSSGQVALNWTMRKGVVPIPGAKTQRQAQENLGALGWELTEEEINSIDDIAT